jgi:hypothetical protein
MEKQMSESVVVSTVETIGHLYAALAKAQGEIVGAKKDSENPFFHSSYADLASVWDACRGPLTKNGLSIIQRPACRFIGEPVPYVWIAKGGEERHGVHQATEVQVLTTLAHSSGACVEGTISCVLADANPQEIGSAITYLRRYALQSIVGIAPEDDDAETTTTHESGGRAAKSSAGPRAAASAGEGSAPCPQCGKAARISNFPKAGKTHYCYSCKHAFEPGGGPANEPGAAEASELFK